MAKHYRNDPRNVSLLKFVPIELKGSFGYVERVEWADVEWVETFYGSTTSIQDYMDDAAGCEISSVGVLCKNRKPDTTNLQNTAW